MTPRWLRTFFRCAAKTLTHGIHSFCYVAQHNYQMTCLTDIKYERHRSAHSFGRHSNWLLHSAPCCLSMSLTYTAVCAPALSSRPHAQFIKTSAGTNQIPAVWWLSYPAVTHNKIAGQRLAASSQRSKCQACDGKSKEMSESVLLRFQGWYLHGHCSVFLLNSSSSCQVDTIAGKYNTGTWFHPLEIGLLYQTRSCNNTRRYCTNSKNSVLYHKY